MKVHAVSDAYKISFAIFGSFEMFENLNFKIYDVYRTCNK